MTPREELKTHLRLKEAKRNGNAREELKARLALRNANPTNIDRDTGSNYGVRSAVGSALGQKDKLATLQKFFPDAQPFGEDNFIFTHPETKRPTLVNPEGLDVGDLFGAGREISQLVGGAGGGLLGLSGGPWGAAAGGALGSQMAGQAHDAVMRGVGGTVDTRNLAEKGADAAIETGLETVIGKVAEGVPHLAKELYGKAASPFRNRTANAAAPQLLSDFQQAGIPIEGAAGAISGSPMMQKVWTALSNLPGSTGTVQRAATRTIDAATGVHRQVSGKYGEPAAKLTVGESMQQSSEGAVERFKSRQLELDKAIGHQSKILIPGGAEGEVFEEKVRAALPAISKLRQEVAKGFEEAPDVLAQLGKILKELDHIRNCSPPQKK
ncbi:MAG: hypothetical protein HQL52_19730 [Magnetococcales bacterium]|nr:hypothetical protein [Magnetococcales bacterium]